MVSGNGSNLQALIDADLPLSNGHIVGVISNRADAYALKRAQAAGIATAIIMHRDYPNRTLFDAALHQQLLAWQIDYILLAGFMRILTPQFVAQWAGRMLNIHPSLLPAYKGLNTHQRVLASGDRLHGCSVHFVTAELDGGQIITQGVLQVGVHDTPEQLAARVHQLEHQIYPMAVRWLCSGIISLKNQHLIFNGQSQTQPFQLYFDLNY